MAGVSASYWGFGSRCVAIVFFGCCSRVSVDVAVDSICMSAVVVACCCSSCLVFVVLLCSWCFNMMFQLFFLCCCNNMFKMFRCLHPNVATIIPLFVCCNTHVHSVSIASPYCCSRFFGVVATTCSWCFSCFILLLLWQRGGVS